MKRLVALLTTLLIVCGSPAAANPEPHREPYGLWVERGGDAIIVRRDGSYSYCSPRFGCEGGRYKSVGDYDVELLGFCDLKGTETLRALTGWQFAIDTSPPEQLDDAKATPFGDLEQSNPYRHTLCKDQSCAIVGPTDQGYQAVFFLVAAY